jgi:hypothetical protein
MPEELPSYTPPAPGASEPTGTAAPETSFNIGEEFGTAKRNLPPAKIVAITLGVAAVIIGVFAFVQRAKPQGGGSVDNISAAAVPDQQAVLVAVNVTLRNAGPKPLYIHTIKGTLKTDSGEFSDDAASAVDFDRYFQSFPALREHAMAAITPETKIPPDSQSQGTVIFYFPVAQDAFEKRKSLSVVIQPYDQPVPITLTK